MDKKNELYKELFELLGQLIKAYRLLLDSVRREKELLIEVNIDELNENNKAKDAAIDKLKTLEKKRIRIVRDLAGILNINETPVRLLDLAGAFEDQRSDELRNKHSVLDLLIQRVIELNKQNETLAQSALKNVTGAMSAIKETLKEKPTYERKGAVKNSPSQGGHLVRREV